MNEDTMLYVELLHSIADNMEKRGIEPGSVEFIQSCGTTEMTQEGDKVRHYKVTKDRFFTIIWRQEDES